MSLILKTETMWGGVLLATLIGTGCSSQSQVAEVLDSSGASRPLDGDTTDSGAQQALDRPADSTDAAVEPEFNVPSDSEICGADLPFQPPGCPCTAGETANCWTGPADQRNVGDCKDGLQECQGTGEFLTWGACEGAVTECGQEEQPPPEEEDCGCVPGTVIGCDEDCAAFVFCSPLSTKECQPDGTFGPCREALTSGLVAEERMACLNVFHGCFPENEDGLFVGDCDSAFTCKHPPGPPADETPDEPPSSEAPGSTPGEII